MAQERVQRVGDDTCLTAVALRSLTTLLKAPGRGVANRPWLREM